MTAGGIVDDADPSAELDRLRGAYAASQEECDRLTTELGHRVKNTLSMVQALANQTFRDCSSVDEALRRFSERVVSLARANDAILKERWTSASLEGVVRGILTPHGLPLGPLTIAGPPRRLGAGAALSVALALHEMASNARRFGAWHRPDGHVAVEWALRRTPEGELFDMSWTETGGASVSAPETRGLGLRLAEQSLRSAFGRDVVFDFRPEGFQCRISAVQAALAG